MRLLVLQFAALQEHRPITSARLAEGIASTTASANRDAKTQPRLRAMSTLSICSGYLRGSFENAAFYQRRRAPARTDAGTNPLLRWAAGSIAVPSGASSARPRVRLLPRGPVSTQRLTQTPRNSPSSDSMRHSGRLSDRLVFPDKMRRGDTQQHGCRRLPKPKVACSSQAGTARYFSQNPGAKISPDDTPRPECGHDVLAAGAAVR
jgi:hypothetical protein